jgi:quercetin dioxygenase-like cupin family protein
MKTTRLPHEELDRWPGRVNQDGGDLRIVRGADHGLSVSLMLSEVPPGSGPVRHRHPHGEVFVVHEGEATFEVEGDGMRAEGGDVVIVPPNAWHVFSNTGGSPLRLTAIHESPRAVTEWEDGTRRE